MSMSFVSPCMIWKKLLVSESLDTEAKSYESREFMKQLFPTFISPVIMMLYLKNPSI